MEEIFSNSIKCKNLMNQWTGIIEIENQYTLRNQIKLLTKFYILVSEL